MKNTKEIIQKIGRYIYKIMVTLGAIIIVMFPVYLAALWIISDYNPHFLAIDSCLDRGGVWHYVADVCYYTDEEQVQLEKLYGPGRPN